MPYLNELAELRTHFDQVLAELDRRTEDKIGNLPYLIQRQVRPLTDPLRQVIGELCAEVVKARADCFECVELMQGLAESLDQLEDRHEEVLRQWAADVSKRRRRRAGV